MPVSRGPAFLVAEPELPAEPLALALALAEAGLEPPLPEPLPEPEPEEPPLVQAAGAMVA